jgi:hypothetical protein
MINVPLLPVVRSTCVITDDNYFRYVDAIIM